MSKHTPEPWLRSSDDFVVAESDQLNNGEYILSCFGPDQAANARRIVACVNACAGVDTDLLEAGELDKPTMLVMQENKELKRCCDELRQERQREHDLRVSLTGELDVAKQQADEMLAALEAVIKWYDMEADHSIEPDFYKRVAACKASEDMGRAAIAKAKGGAA